MKPKTPTNPRGAGRPRKEEKAATAKADPSRQASAPPPPSVGDDTTGDMKREAKRLKTLKITPELARELGVQVAMAEAIPYAVAARATEDERWALTDEEVKILGNVWGTAIMVYSDQFAAWLPLFMLATTNAAPLVGRLMMPKLKKSNMGEPKK